MAFVNQKGMQISFACQDLIDSLKDDIADFGAGVEVDVCCRERHGVILYVDYDYIDEDDPIQKLEENDFIKRMTMGELLPLLIKQNTVI
jgi:uncharacterized protein YlbG (UPF0298 family)